MSFHIKNRRMGLVVNVRCISGNAKCNKFKCEILKAVFRYRIKE